MEQFRPFVEKLPDFFKPWGEEILLRYFDFEGRTSRATYWHCVLINIIIGAIFSLLIKVPLVGMIAGIVDVVYGIFMIVPGITITVRRLNDTGKSWPYIFFALIPCVGWIIMLVFMLQDSQ